MKMGEGHSRVDFMKVQSSYCHLQDLMGYINSLGLIGVQISTEDLKVINPKKSLCFLMAVQEERNMTFKGNKMDIGY